MRSSPSALGLTHSDYCANTGTADPETPSGATSNCLTSLYPKCAWDRDASTGDGVVYQASQVRPASLPTA